MSVSNTSLPRFANPHRLWALVLCIALAACGTKPKNFTEHGFPATYPPPETTAPANPPPPAPNPPGN